jgi:hypothetical protein
MRRRAYISSVAVLSSVAAAGCSSDSDNGDTGNEESGNGDSGNQQTPSVSQVSVSAEDYTAVNAVQTINLSYATQTAIDGYMRDPDSGNKWVILHGEITFESELDSEVDIYSSAIALETNGVISEATIVAGQSGLSQTVRPGATFDGWQAFQVPEETEEATLVGNDVDAWYDNPTEILFEQSDSLSAEIPDE